MWVCRHFRSNNVFKTLAIRHEGIGELTFRRTCTRNDPRSWRNESSCKFNSTNSIHTTESCVWYSRRLMDRYWSFQGISLLFRRFPLRCLDVFRGTTRESAFFFQFIPWAVRIQAIFHELIGVHIAQRSKMTYNRSLNDTESWIQTNSPKTLFFLSYFAFCFALVCFAPSAILKHVHETADQQGRSGIVVQRTSLVQGIRPITITGLQDGAQDLHKVERAIVIHLITPEGYGQSWRRYTEEEGKNHSSIMEGLLGS